MLTDVGVYVASWSRRTGRLLGSIHPLPNTSVLPECRSDQYGPDCSLRCQCASKSQCNPYNGNCVCPATWMGPTCKEGNISWRCAAFLSRRNHALVVVGRPFGQDYQPPTQTWCSAGATTVSVSGCVRQRPFCISISGEKPRACGSSSFAWKGCAGVCCPPKGPGAGWCKCQQTLQMPGVVPGGCEVLAKLNWLSAVVSPQSRLRSGDLAQPAHGFLRLPPAQLCQRAIHSSVPASLKSCPEIVDIHSFCKMNKEVYLLCMPTRSLTFCRGVRFWRAWWDVVSQRSR